MAIIGVDETTMEEFSFKEDDEETLSLCDLPVNKEENQIRNETQASKAEEDFEFGSWGCSVLKDSEMCVADDVFFQGQILPLRFSVSSENGFAGIKQDSKNPSRSGSRSESMEHCSSEVFTSETSRSSSMSSNSSILTRKYKPIKMRNQFDTHPSPNPQIRFSGVRPRRIGNQSRKSTIWGFFRLGPVKTPEIQLGEMKQRKKNKSFSSNSSRSSNNGRERNEEAKKLEKKKRINQKFFKWSNCKCSLDAIETVSSKISINNSKIRDLNNGKVINGGHGKEENGSRQVREVKTENQKQGKQGMSHRRTFEWLKELSIEDTLEEA